MANEVSFREMIDEIKQLQNDKYVKLAMREDKIKRVLDANIRTLRKLQQRGMELERQGVTAELLRGDDCAEDVF